MTLARNKHRYSFLITPVSYILDVIFILIFFLYLVKVRKSGVILFNLAAWTIIAIAVQYYILNRYITFNELLGKYFKQIIIFNLALLSGFQLGHWLFNNSFLLPRLAYLDLLFLVKIITQFWFLKKYRQRGYNLRHYVIFGYNDDLKKFKELVDKRTDFGYRFIGFFDNENAGKHPEVAGTFQEGLEYVCNNLNDVDIIFASLRHSDEELLKLVDVSEDCFKELKFIPDNREFFQNRLYLEYMDFFPVLTLEKSPLDKPLNAMIKRVFDIVFSLFVVIFILSWLTPVLGLLIKLESKGPIFFKQKRNGEFYKPFYLYKFRSMRPNDLADKKQVSRDDDRVTRIGRFIRKTSIDELPQFFNVLFGNMSVVGPRPHMVKENERFKARVHKFLPRHQVKPGITGLAQVKGYRGEVVTDEDIINRVKYDIYYIKNWSFLLDIKIILLTIINTLKGDKKAY